MALQVLSSHPWPLDDVPSCSQGYPLTTPGSTASTVEMSPGTLLIPSLSSVAAQCAGMPEGPPGAPESTRTQNLPKRSGWGGPGLIWDKLWCGRGGSLVWDLNMIHGAGGLSSLWAMESQVRRMQKC